MSPRLPSIFDFSLGDSLSGAAREGGARPAGWHLDAVGVPFLRGRGLTGRGVRIGVVDTGVMANHPDFDRDRITVLDRQEGGDGIDANGHGTAMVGLLIGAQGPVAPDCEVISVKAFSDSGTGFAKWIAEGIDRALDADADVISVSLGTTGAGGGLSEAVQRAVERDVVIVAAADDQSSTAALYPAMLAPVVAVTAADEAGRLLFPVLPRWVDLALPGVDLASLNLEGRRATVAGTSPATVLAAGLCGLLLGLTDDPARRRLMARHLLAFLTEPGALVAGASGPGDCRLLNVPATAARIDDWLRTTPFEKNEERR